MCSGGSWKQDTALQITEPCFYFGGGGSKAGVLVCLFFLSTLIEGGLFLSPHDVILLEGSLVAPLLLEV